MLIKEFRIPLPLDIGEYQVAQLYTVTEMSKQETTGDSGVEILANEPYDNSEYGTGQYTHKIYYLGSHIPSFLKSILPSSALQLEEKAWNSFPHCKTVLTNKFLGERFSLSIETWHKSQTDLENVHGLSGQDLERREVVYIDISKPPGTEEPPDIDPASFSSSKTGRGPLKSDWIQYTKPIMCCYKLVMIKFRVFGLERRVENLIARTQLDLFHKFHRQLFCLIDRWFGLTIDDIRQLEEETRTSLSSKVPRNPPGNHQVPTHQKTD